MEDPGNLTEKVIDRFSEKPTVEPERGRYVTSSPGLLMHVPGLEVSFWLGCGIADPDLDGLFHFPN